MNFPTGPEMTADALAMNRDAALLETAIRRCWDPNPSLSKKMIQQWTPKETEGGCMGGEWRVYFAQGSCACPEEHPLRSEEHTSELQSLMRSSYAVFCLKKKIHYRDMANLIIRCM